MKCYSTAPYVQHALLCVLSQILLCFNHYRGSILVSAQTDSHQWTAISLAPLRLFPRLMQVWSLGDSSPPKWKERYGRLKLPQDICSCLSSPGVSVTHSTGLPGQQLRTSSRVCPKSRLELRMLNYNIRWRCGCDHHHDVRWKCDIGHLFVDHCGSHF